MNVLDLAYSLTAPVEAVMFFMMFDAFLEKRKSFPIWQYVVGVFILAVIFRAINLWLMFRIGNAICMVLAACLVSWYFYNTSISKRLFVSLFTWVVLIGVIEIFVLNVIGLLFGVTANDAVSVPEYVVLGIIVSKSLGLAICYAICVKSKLRDFELGINYWIIFVLLFITSIVAVFFILTMLYALNDPSYNLMAIICTIGLFASTFLALYLYQRSVRQSQIIHQQEQAEQQMQHQLKHLDEIILKQNELRRIRHDINDHFTALKGYLDAEDIPGGQHYLAELTEEFQTAAPSIQTGNNALDAILSAKQSLADSKHIAFTTKIRIQRALPIDPRDLCIIFGNALDNAIEACDRLPEQAEKHIDLLLMEETETLYCKITNTAPPRRTAVFTTSKSDPINHGFGLNNIRDALEKYNVTLKLSQNDNLFTLEFLLFF